MATGAYDANGIWQYGESDPIALFSDLLNLGQESTSDAFTDDRARISYLENNLAQAISPRGNALLNADFKINQRGFTSITTDNNYGFDRWAFTGSNATYTPQTFTPGAAPYAGYEAQFFARLVTSGQTTGTRAAITQRIEDVRSFAGQTITISFFAKAATGTPKIGLALFQNFGTGGSATVAAASSATTTISSSWGRYSVTLTLPSISGKTVGTNSYLQLDLLTSVGSSLVAGGYPNIGTQNITVDFWGIQLEAGELATSFKRATDSLALELVACQRYYYKASDTYVTGLLAGTTDTQRRAWLQYPVTMRAVSTDYSATWFTGTSPVVVNASINGFRAVATSGNTTAENYVISWYANSEL